MRHMQKCVDMNFYLCYNEENILHNINYVVFLLNKNPTFSVCLFAASFTPNNRHWKKSKPSSKEHQKFYSAPFIEFERTYCTPWGIAMFAQTSKRARDKSFLRSFFSKKRPLPPAGGALTSDDIFEGNKSGFQLFDQGDQLRARGITVYGNVSA